MNTKDTIAKGLIVLKMVAGSTVDVGVGPICDFGSVNFDPGAVIVLLFMKFLCFESKLLKPRNIVEKSQKSCS